VSKEKDVWFVPIEHQDGTLWLKLVFKKSVPELKSWQQMPRGIMGPAPAAVFPK